MTQSTIEDNGVETKFFEDYVYLTTDDESNFKYDLIYGNMISFIESVRKVVSVH